MLVLALVTGCPAATEATPKREEGARKSAHAETKPDVKTTETKTDAALGRVLDGPMPIAGMLGKPPTEVQTQLGEPLGKGMTRKTCVRFVPERTWFSCSFATQRYGDKSGAYKAIGVEYQDGKSTAIAFEGPTNATGPFDARAALAYVGLELPGEPKVETHEGDAIVYSWFNAASRLLVDGRQYRVVVSSVGSDWSRAKIEVVLNDPLDESERASVITPPAADAP